MSRCVIPHLAESTRAGARVDSGETGYALRRAPSKITTGAPRLGVTRILLLGLLVPLHGGCLFITTRTVVRADGAIERGVLVRTKTPQPIPAIEKRFPPPWKAERGADGLSVEAFQEIPPGGALADNDTRLSVTWSHRFFFTEYRLTEDYSRFRLGRNPPVIAPRPPPPLPILAWLRALAHEKNLAAIERRFRENVKLRAEVRMPGRIRSSNHTSVDADGTLIWEFNLRAPHAPGR